MNDNDSRTEALAMLADLSADPVRQPAWLADDARINARIDHYYLSQNGR